MGLNIILKPLILVFVLVGIVACDDILEVPDISDRQLIVLAPLEGATINGNQVSFNWNALIDADGYKVEVATPDFENAAQLVLDSLIVYDTLGNLATSLKLALLNGDYQWRIKGVNSGYATAFAENRFTVDGDSNADIVAPNTPMLVSPGDSTTQEETEVTFSWTREDVAGTAERDSIYIFNDEALQDLSTKGLGANKTFDATLATGTYYWTVRAFDAGGNRSDTSNTFILIIN